MSRYVKQTVASGREMQSDESQKQTTSKESKMKTTLKESKMHTPLDESQRQTTSKENQKQSPLNKSRKQILSVERLDVSSMVARDLVIFDTFTRTQLIALCKNQKVTKDINIEAGTITHMAENNEPFAEGAILQKKTAEDLFKQPTEERKSKTAIEYLKCKTFAVSYFDEQYCLWKRLAEAEAKSAETEKVPRATKSAWPLQEGAVATEDRNCERISIEDKKFMCFAMNLHIYVMQKLAERKNPNFESGRICMTVPEDVQNTLEVSIDSFFQNDIFRAFYKGYAIMEVGHNTFRDHMFSGLLTVARREHRLFIAECCKFILVGFNLALEGVDHLVTNMVRYIIAEVCRRTPQRDHVPLWYCDRSHDGERIDFCLKKVHEKYDDQQKALSNT